MEQLQQKIRAIPDFPEPGIVFRDITPLLRDPALLKLAAQSMAEPFRDHPVSAVVGMEARGFIFGALVAYEMNCGFVPLRKPGKLPYETRSRDYALEYGTNALEIHIDALSSDDNVLLVDDLLATGGTAAASAALVHELGAQLAGCAFLIELAGLGGRDALAPHPVHSVMQF
ncbi:MAG: adenine phosphoribosyltransferase [Gammaproteobacteria bacterium]|nr:adenine phosphoribosyltransferase [Gammaproteobacteria bacterium]